MDIEWPPFPPDGGLPGRPATEDDLAAGRAAFVLRDDAGRLVGSPIKMGMPRLGFYTDGLERRLDVAVQVEATGGRCIVRYDFLGPSQEGQRWPIAVDRGLGLCVWALQRIRRKAVECVATGPFLVVSP